jgi:hypothetical protein
MDTITMDVCQIEVAKNRFSAPVATDLDVGTVAHWPLRVG